MDHHFDGTTTQSIKVKLSKRVNARLQLAAALIEADNEEIEERNERERGGRQEGSQGDGFIDPAPPIALKLASESILFGPYQTPRQGEPHQSPIGAGLDAEGRPLIDFLGVRLPTEKRWVSAIPEEGVVGGRHGRVSSPTMTNRASSEWHSRPASMTGGTLSAQRPRSAMSRSQTDMANSRNESGEGEEELVEWGVEKFLSSEARQRIETGRQSRTNSLVGIERPQSVLSDYSASGGRAQSEVGTVASAKASVDISASKLSLLTKIKMYREGQKEKGVEEEEEGEEDIYGGMRSSSPVREQPVSSMSPDGKRLSGHLEALTRADGSSVGIIPHARSAVFGRRGQDGEEWRQSKAAVMGECWSEQGDDSVDHSTSFSHTVGKLMENEDGGGVESIPPPRIRSPIEEYEQHADGMAGIGSFSRSPHSRGNSISGGSFFLGATASPFPAGEQVQNGNPSRPATPASPGIAAEFSRPHSAAFLAGPDDGLNQGYQEEALSRTQTGGTLLTPGSLPSRPNSTSPMRPSMLNPAFSPRIRPHPDHLLAAIDPFPELSAAGFSPYPRLGSPASRMNMMAAEPYEAVFGQGLEMGKPSPSMQSLSTKQLQELARQSSFPASYSLSNNSGPLVGLPDEDAEMVKAEMEVFEAEERHDTLAPAIDLPPRLTPPDAEEGEQELLPLPNRPLEAYFGANQEPDLSSARWGRKKRKSLLAGRVRSHMAATVAFPRTGDQQQEARVEEVDDEYTSPPSRGPLRPRGVESRLPKTLKLPQPLSGTSLAPRLRLVDEERMKDQEIKTGVGKARVPKGFVLHNRTETLSMKSLQVQGASGARPFFMSPEGKQTHDRLVGDFLQSSNAKRVIQVPCIAPAGIGRRAAMKTTALFRNQLVQHEEEKEGWGWEVGSKIGTELAEEGDSEEEEVAKAADVMAGKKKKRWEKKREKKMLKEKEKRKEARRVRRKKRALARSRNLSFDEVGVEEFSPDEDLGLSETSSEESGEDGRSEGGSGESEVSWNSDDEERWLDERKPAGRLYGKSLLDVMDERKKTVTSKARQYGQVQPEDAMGLRDDQSAISASVGGASFRDNPVGFNDTRERMEAAFGPDRVWGAEMARRKLQEAKEAEEEAIMAIAREEVEEERRVEKGRKKARKAGRTGKKGRGSKGEATEVELEKVSTIHTPTLCTEVNDAERSVDPPTVQLDLPLDSQTSQKSSFSNVGAAWLEGRDDDESSSSDESEAREERRRAAMQRARLSRSLGGQGLKMAVDIMHDDEGQLSEEDDVPLDQLRARMPPSNLAAQLAYGAREEEKSDEEEGLSLAQLVAARKKRVESMGTLDLNFMIGEASSDPKANAEEDEDDQPLGLKLLDAEATLATLMSQQARQALDEEDDDDDDDRPLGAAHPQAAIIAEQASLIKQLQSELMTKQTIHAPFPIHPRLSFLPPPAFFPTPLLAPHPPPPAPLHLSAPPRGVSIAHWAAQVPVDAAGSDPHSRSGSGRGSS